MARNRRSPTPHAAKPDTVPCTKEGPEVPFYVRFVSVSSYFRADSDLDTFMLKIRVTN